MTDVPPGDDSLADVGGVPLDMGDALEVVVKGRAPDFSEIGSTGLRHSGGFINEEFLRQLQGDRALKVNREMADNDPVVGAMLFAVDMLARQVEWRVVPPEAQSVEDIVAARQQDRARAIQAAQAADLQRQQGQQAQAAAMQGKRPDGSPIIPDKGGPNSNAPSKEAVKKAIKEFGLDLDPEEWTKAFQASRVLKAAAPANTNTAGDQAAAAGKTPPPPSVPDPGKPVTDPLDPRIQGDPAQLAVQEGEDIAVFVETCIHDMAMSWEDTLTTILSMLPYGWHTAEIVYKKRMGATGDPNSDSRFNDGKIGWRYLPPRSQDTRHRWEIDPETGELLGMWQFDPSARKGLVFLPTAKMLLFRTENRKGNPEGRSILRSAYRPWFFKKRIEEIEAIGIERDLAGLPVAFVPATMLSSAATADEINTLQQIMRIVRNIKRDEREGVVFPMSYDPESGKQLFDLKLLSTGGQRQFDTDKIIGRFDQRIVMCILADFILLGHENVGSKSLGKSKIDLFTAALEAWLDSIAEVFNTYAIPRLLKMNGMDPAASPKLVHGRLSQVDLGALGTFLLQVSQAGAPLFPDDGLETYLRDVAGLPTKEGGQDL